MVGFVHCALSRHFMSMLLCAIHVTQGTHLLLLDMVVLFSAYRAGQGSARPNMLVEASYFKSIDPSPLALNHSVMLPSKNARQED